MLGRVIRLMRGIPRSKFVNVMLARPYLDIRFSWPEQELTYQETIQSYTDQDTIHRCCVIIAIEIDAAVAYMAHQYIRAWQGSLKDS